MSIFYPLVTLILVITFIGLMLLDNYLYYKKLERQKRREEAIKRKRKKRLKEFKWPENLPHHDLYYKEK